MSDSIVFVFDTAYFESIGYDFESAVFERIKIGVNQHECMKLYIPEIVDKEIRKHIAEICSKTRANIRGTPKIVRDVILKDDFQDLRGLTDLITHNAIELYDSFIDEFRINIISNDKECNDEMWDRYFTSKPPFSNKKKKEFPDAMALLSMRKYFEKTNIDFDSIIVATNDDDWKKYCNEIKLTVVTKEHELLGVINSWQPILNESIFLKLLDDDTKQMIIDKIKSYFDDINIEPSDDYMVDFEVVDFGINNISKGEIISVTENEINLLYEVHYYADICYLEPGSWGQDYDTKEIFYTESISATIESQINTEIKVIIESPIEKIDVNYYCIEEKNIIIVLPESLILDTNHIDEYGREFGYFKY